MKTSALVLAAAALGAVFAEESRIDGTEWQDLSRMSLGRDFDVKTPLAAWRNYNALEMVWRDTVRLAVPRGHAGIEEMGSFYHCVRDDDAWARFSRRYAGGIIEARLDALEAGVPFDDIIS